MTVTDATSTTPADDATGDDTALDTEAMAHDTVVNDAVAGETVLPDADEPVEQIDEDDAVAAADAEPEADALGVTDSQRRGRRYRTLSRGVHAPAGWGCGPDGEEPGRPAVLAGARPVLALTPGSVLSHASAGLVWGFRLPRRLQEARPIHVTRVDDGVPPRRRMPSAITKPASIPAAKGVPPPPGSPARLRFARTSERVGGKSTCAAVPRNASTATRSRRT